MRVCLQELDQKYSRVSEEEAREGWEAQYEASLHSCMHGDHCQQGSSCQVSWCSSVRQPPAPLQLPSSQVPAPRPSGGLTCAAALDVESSRAACVSSLAMLSACRQPHHPAQPLQPLLRLSRTVQVGRRLTGVTILSGSVVRIWDCLERVLSRHELELSKSDRVTRIVRVDFADGSLPLIGEWQRLCLLMIDWRALERTALRCMGLLESAATELLAGLGVQGLDCSVAGVGLRMVMPFPAAAAGLLRLSWLTDFSAAV